MKGRFLSVNNFKFLILLASMVTANCAASKPPIEDATELAPPRKVTLQSVDDHVEIFWQASPDENDPDFAGYNIYYAPRSLILTRIRDLPLPIKVAKDQHAYIFTNLDRHKTYFVNVRSRSRKGKLSLPSLPELIIAPQSSNL